MRITQGMVHDATVLEMADEFTHTTRKLFSSPVERVRQTECRHLILNVREVTCIDRTAMGLLALTVQQCKADGKQGSVVAPLGTVKQVLDLFNISQLIPVYPTEEAAIRGVAA